MQSSIISVSNFLAQLDFTPALLPSPPPCVSNTRSETAPIKTAAMTEMAIVYGNRYRPVNRNLDISLTKAEELFFKGDYKKALETTIRAIELVEPGVHEKLLEEVKK